VSLAVVGQRLAAIASDFDSRTYGYRKLSDLVRKTGEFDMEQPKGLPMRIRLRTQSAHQIMTAAKATDEAKFRASLS
jgi:hypothetical protein